MLTANLPMIDLVLLCFVLGFVLVGFWLGLIHMIGSVIGFVAGVVVAGHFFDEVADLIIGVFPGANANLTRVIVFFLLYLLVTRAVSLAIHLIDKIFRIISIIPFVKTFNRLLGALLGLLEGLLVMGLVVFFASRFPFGPAFETALRSSVLAKILFYVGKALSPLLPEALRLIQPVIS